MRAGGRAVVVVAAGARIASAVAAAGRSIVAVQGSPTYVPPRRPRVLQLRAAWTARAPLAGASSLQAPAYRLKRGQALVLLAWH